ncbi:MAG: trypsin-like peptidase domain-containing protein [Actinomycetota bacterium]
MALAALIACVAVACADTTPASEPSSTPPPTAPEVLALRAQACERPQPRNGAAVVVAPQLAATAAHLVEGNLRSLEVDGRPAHVAAIDTDADLALLVLAAEATGSPAATLQPPEPGAAAVITPTDRVDAEVVDVVTLRVDNRGDDRVDERRSAKLDIDVQPGDSGSALIDEQGRLVGIITLRRPSTGVSYATSAEELQALLADTEPAANLAPTDQCV